MSIRSDLSINWNTDPRIITIAAPSTELSVQDQVDTCRAFEDLTYADSYDYLIDATGKEEIGGGVKVGVTSSAKNVQFAFEARTASVSEGTCTTADSGGITLIDSAATFEADGVKSGAIIINFTDKSVATVISVDSETQITHENLADGTNNDWTSTDVYKIWNWITCELSGGNTVAEDKNGTAIDVLLPRFGVSYVRTSSSSATIQDLVAITETVWDTIYIDTDSGIDSTIFPYGTAGKPCKTITNARTIAEAQNTKKIHLQGSITLDGNFDNYVFLSESAGRATINLNNQSANNAVFNTATLTGSLSDSSYLANRCTIYSQTNINAGWTDCLVIAGAFTIAPGQALNGDKCGFLGNVIFDLNGNGNLALSNASGQVTLANMTDINSVISFAGNYVLTSMNTITAGTMLIAGIGVHYNYANGATVIDKTLPSAVWEHDSGEFLLKVVKNKKGLAKNGLVWELIIYDDDDVTPVLTKEIKDKDGNNITDLEAGVLAQELASSA